MDVYNKCEYLDSKLVRCNRNCKSNKCSAHKKSFGYEPCGDCGHACKTASASRGLCSKCSMRQLMREKRRYAQLLRREQVANKVARGEEKQRPDKISSQSIATTSSKRTTDKKQ